MKKNHHSLRGPVLGASFFVVLVLAAMAALYQTGCSSNPAPTSSSSSPICPAYGLNDQAASITSFVDLVDSCPGNLNVIGIPVSFAVAGSVEGYSLFLKDTSVNTSYSSPDQLQVGLFTVSGGTATYIPFSSSTPVSLSGPVTASWRYFPADPFYEPAGNYLLVAMFHSPSANASTLSVGYQTGSSTCSDDLTCTSATSLNTGFSPWTLSTATPLTYCMEGNVTVCH